MATPGLDSEELVIGASGHIYVGPTSATAPTNATTAPAGGYTDIGFTTEDGVRFRDEKTITDINAWQSFYPLKKLVTARASSVAFVMEQWNHLTVPIAFGGGTITGSGSDFHYVPPDPSVLDERRIIVDILDGDDILRFYLPKVISVETVEAQFARNVAGLLPVTFAVVGVAGEAPWEFFTHDADFSAT